MFIDWFIHKTVLEKQKKEQKRLNDEKFKKQIFTETKKEILPFNVSQLFEEPKYQEKRIEDFNENVQ